jgi:hypothetical protein
VFEVRAGVYCKVNQPPRAGCGLLIRLRDGLARGGIRITKRAKVFWFFFSKKELLAFLCCGRLVDSIDAGAQAGL